MTAQPPRPTDAELEILTVLWSIGPSTVRGVYEEISRRRVAQYSTVLKFMQIMAEKGLVVRDEDSGRTFTRPRSRASGRSSSLRGTCCTARLTARPKPF